MKHPLPDSAIEIFLQPGEYYWGDQYTRIRTILGSCVAVVAWHPQKLVGGMTHIMLAEKPEKHKLAQTFDGKYADDAINMLLADIHKQSLAVHEFQIKLFGGGDMFESSGNGGLDKDSVGEKNVNKAKALLKAKGYKIHAEHIRGRGHRSIIFDVWNGHVWMKHVEKEY
jgi:chemotaxis protein CheD